MKKFALCILVLTLCKSIIYAQSLSQQSGIGPGYPSGIGASFYYVAKPGDVTIQVNVWGQVQKPGRFEIPTGTNLMQLLSYAGGPLQYANLSDVILVHQHLDSLSATTSDVVLDLDKMMERGESIPILRPGDTIVIKASSWLTWRDIFTGVATAATVAIAVSEVLFYMRNR